MVDINSGQMVYHVEWFSERERAHVLFLTRSTRNVYVVRSICVTAVVLKTESGAHERALFI